MEEKIKIYVPQEIESTLTRDADFFEFYKKDHSLNRNDFLNTLIVNYFDSYSHNDNVLSGKLEEIFRNELADQNELSDLSARLLNAVKDYQYSSPEARSDVTVSIKPTKRSAGVIEYIQNEYLRNISLSGYFRNMFSSYCQLPQDKRERIIFRDKFDAVSRAISERKMIYFTTSKSGERHEAMPYAIARSQEELFNYLVCIYNGSVFSFRMTRLQNVRILNKPAEFSEEQKELLEKTRQFPQFACNRKEEICVMLSQRGIRLFDRIYSYRPKPIRILKDLYYFDCTAEQIYHYFIRFGRHAKVIYPESLKQRLYYDYANAAREYEPNRKQ